ncbi:MAG: DUF87 domain-containing protein [Candidatus Micrarchaeota archaeon]|nr:DUF87 domain-containing protein [Candidatus Micrarchaeota archaeon]
MEEESKMPGYRTIPSKDTFDIEERLGGIITIKQLVYLVITFALTYFTMIISSDWFENPSDSIYVWGTVLFLCLVFIFGNLDKEIYKRLRYYFAAEKTTIEKNPALLSNINTIEENKIITLDGRVIAILKISPINFPILAEEAKEAKISSFEMYLRQLVYPIAHHVQSNPVDITKYASNILKKAKEQKNSAIEEHIEKHLEFLRNYLKEKEVRVKNHYIVIQVQDERYKISATTYKSPPIKKIYLKLRSILKEFNPVSIFYGGKLFEKPKNYVAIDPTACRMIFVDEKAVPTDLKEGKKITSSIVEFPNMASLLKYAAEKQKTLYFGELDIEEMLKKEFMQMPLIEREKVFSLEERRKNVGISGGKTRWAFDECEKYVEVITDKLEAAGLKVKRLKNQDLYNSQINQVPTHVEVHPQYLKVDNEYFKVIYATGYPYQVTLGWLTNIVDGRADYDLTLYIYPVPINEALKTFRTAILKLNTEKKARADFLDPETQQHLEDVTNFYSNIVAGKEKYFQASLYVTSKAKSLKYLDTVVEKAKSDLAGSSIDFEIANYNMAKAVFSTRLTGFDLLNKKREFPSSSLAATFPHISSSVEIDDEGMFFAFDMKDSPIIIDLKKLPNQHISILGESGSGKSYFAKSLIPKYLALGYRVFVTDPDGEYIYLAKKFGGEVSTISTKDGQIINPFDANGWEINDKIRSLIGFFSIIIGDLNKYQQGIISDILVELYEKNKEPTMSDFAEMIKNRLKKVKDEKLRQELQFILLTIKPFLKGNIYGFFDNKTTIELKKQFYVFDLKEYKNDKTLKDLSNYLIFDYISHQLLRDQTPKALIMDEGWTMVNYAGSEEYVRYIIKDSRKYNVSFVFITQELEDMLSSSAGKSILNNTSTQFIFHHKESAMPLAKEVLNLTEAEYEKLLTVGIGEGLMICDKNRLFFKVKTAPLEHQNIEEGVAKKEKKIKLKLNKESEPILPIEQQTVEQLKKELGLVNLPLALVRGQLKEKEKELIIRKIKKNKKEKEKRKKK